MGKKYNISSKSDMKRFSRDIKNTAMEKAKSAIYDMDFDVECPYCNKHFKMKPGSQYCPKCLKLVPVKLNIKL